MAKGMLLLCILRLLVFVISNSINAENAIDCDPESGWQCDYEAEFSHRNGDHAFCDFEIISLDDNLNEFLNKCYFKKPCLINATLEQWSNAEFWHKSTFLKTFGEYEFDSGKSLDLVLRAGVGELKLTLNQYIERNDKNQNNYLNKEPMYIFDRTIWDTEHGKFRSNHFNTENISFFKMAESNIEYNGAILALGNTGTGATFHAHGENWLFLVSGRKRWFLYPPHLQPVGGFWPGFSSRDWFQWIYPHLDNEYQDDYDNFNEKYNKPRSSIYNRSIHNGENISLNSRHDILMTDYKEMNDNKMYGNSFFKPLECIQSKGQIIYLPEFWWHSVINLGNVVIGAAVQTSHSRTPWMFERDIHDGIRRDINNGNDWTDLEESVQRMDGINAFKRLTKYGPISAVHHFFMGFEFYDMGEYRMAIKHLSDALLMDPMYCEAYSYLSRVYSHDHPNNEFYNLEKAEDILRMGYIVNPNNENIQTELMRVLGQTKQAKLVNLIRRGQPLPPK